MFSACYGHVACLWPAGSKKDSKKGTIVNQTFELKIEGQTKTVEWDGQNGPDAAQRYAAAHPGAVVTGVRKPKRLRTSMFVASVALIVEPGDPRW